jgi:hypothetical protein
MLLASNGIDCALSRFPKFYSIIILKYSGSLTFPNSCSMPKEYANVIYISRYIHSADGEQKLFLSFVDVFFSSSSSAAPKTLSFFYFSVFLDAQKKSAEQHWHFQLT